MTGARATPSPATSPGHLRSWVYRRRAEDRPNGCITRTLERAALAGLQAARCTALDTSGSSLDAAFPARKTPPAHPRSRSGIGRSLLQKSRVGGAQVGGSRASREAGRLSDHAHAESPGRIHRGGEKLGGLLSVGRASNTGPPRRSTTSSSGSRGWRSGSAVTDTATTASGFCSTQAAPTGPYSPPSHPAEIRSASLSDEADCRSLWTATTSQPLASASLRQSASCRSADVSSGRSFESLTYRAQRVITRRLVARGQRPHRPARRPAPRIRRQAGGPASPLPRHAARLTGVAAAYYISILTPTSLHACGALKPSSLAMSDLTTHVTTSNYDGVTP